MNEFVFFASAAATLLGSVLVFSLRNTVYAVVALIVALVGVAVLFFQLGAAFIGALQIILYAGAIMVLFLFVVMLLNVKRDELGVDRRWLQKSLAILVGFVLLAQLVMLGRSLITRGPALQSPEWGSAADLAGSFFSRFILAFELTSLLLLAAMVGAVILARSPRKDEED